MTFLAVLGRALAVTLQHGVAAMFPISATMPARLTSSVTRQRLVPIGTPIPTPIPTPLRESPPIVAA
jgi:hypothetical protein